MGFNLGQVVQWLIDNWAVPAGIVALFFYGRFHFNTPEYALKLIDVDGKPLAEQGQLLGLAQPRFTTSRSRFERYVLRYVCVLVAAFLVIVFLPSLAGDAARLLQLKITIPDMSETVQYRALFALFVVTGLLSSFPGLKKIDSWILTRLHEGALIPEEARRMANLLHSAQFLPREATMEAVRATLSRRDTIRVSEGTADGMLEIALLKAMWLKTQLQELTGQDPKYFKLRKKLEIDLNAIAAITSTLRTDLLAYFEDQEAIVPESARNIDRFIEDNLKDAKVRALSTRRQELLKLCDAIYYRECLIAAMLVYATQFGPDDVEQALRTVMGFQLEVKPTPAWDWNTIFRVVGLLFIASLVFAELLLGALYQFNLDNNWSRDVTKQQIVVSALTESICYGLVMLVAIRLKRYWLPHPRTAHRPDNFVIAFAGFASAALAMMAFQFNLRGEVTTASLFQSTPWGVAGYFAAVYIDRAMLLQPRSNLLAAWQGALQTLAMFLAVMFSPEPVGAKLATAQLMFIAGFLALQWGFSGLVMGLMFQRYYQRPDFVESARATVDATGVITIGDLSFRNRAAAPTQ